MPSLHSSKKKNSPLVGTDQPGAALAQKLAAGGAQPPAPPSIKLPAIAECVEDARVAALDTSPGPSDESDFDLLLQRLNAAKVRLPILYHEAAHTPFVKKLTDLGSAKFTKVMITDPSRMGKLLQDVAHAILQNGERFEDTATDAFEEVVTDLYDGFLSAQDRRGIKTPDRSILPPLVKWGSPSFGPYTWPGDATSTLDLQCAIVSLPPTNASGGLMAWATLPHESAGHDILHADKGLQSELEDAVFQAVSPLSAEVASYWADRIDETASDVMGILNMGPAAAIGPILFFRGLLASLGLPARLRNAGTASDKHPADILRGYLGAATVGMLSFNGAAQWSNLLEQETDKDADATFQLAGSNVPKSVAKKSAGIVAEVIATHRSAALRNHALLDIQDWRDRDEAIVNAILPALVSAKSVPDDINGAGVFAAHVVAAAVRAALTGNATPAIVFQRMITILKSMHDGNPSWGPLHVMHPSSIYLDRAYVI